MSTVPGHTLPFNGTVGLIARAPSRPPRTRRSIPEAPDRYWCPDWPPHGGHLAGPPGWRDVFPGGVAVEAQRVSETGRARTSVRAGISPISSSHDSVTRQAKGAVGYPSTCQQHSATSGSIIGGQSVSVSTWPTPLAPCSTSPSFISAIMSVWFDWRSSPVCGSR